MDRAALATDGVLLYRCPGCRTTHGAETTTPNRWGALWAFNGDLERPTLSPSVNIVGMCHHFVRGGRIEFCSDSSHALAGQTVDLPDWEGV